MKLKKKYQITLFTVIISVPVSVLLINFIMLEVYKIASKIRGTHSPFYKSFAYPTMLVLFVISFFLLSLIFSKTIHSLLKKINTLNQTIWGLASNEKVPNKIEITGKDEMGELTNSVNLLIERTAYREMELKQQEEIQREYLNKLRHDISNPLTAIRLQLFYLEEQETSLSFESLYQQIQYISDLTNEFNLNHIDPMEASYIMMSEVNVSDLLSGMVKKWDYLYSINGIKLNYLSLDEELVWISNNLWLQRLYDNVFQNTLKHSKASTLEIIIQEGVVMMKDNGQGFNYHDDHKGLGLKIIEDLSGLLNIKYSLLSTARGTEFTFTLR